MPLNHPLQTQTQSQAGMVAGAACVGKKRHHCWRNRPLACSAPRNRAATQPAPGKYYPAWQCERVWRHGDNTNLVVLFYSHRSNNPFTFCCWLLFWKGLHLFGTLSFIFQKEKGFSTDKPALCVQKNGFTCVAKQVLFLFSCSVDILCNFKTPAPCWIKRTQIYSSRICPVGLEVEVEKKRSAYGVIQSYPQLWLSMLCSGF